MLQVCGTPFVDGVWTGAVPLGARFNLLATPGSMHVQLAPVSINARGANRRWNCRALAKFVQ
jgi:hypothetical protein